jgi:hypothetical protein
MMFAEGIADPAIDLTGVGGVARVPDDLGYNHQSDVLMNRGSEVWRITHDGR